ncbi:MULTISPECIES: hypothetical protein [unclassified Microcoleus]|uniref:hypothetical protein n=1 Tax=unclassified Microcoleus TaxID=2642155 RepID=UPI002FD618FA
MQLLEIGDGRVNFSTYFAVADRRLQYHRLGNKLVIGSTCDRPFNQFISAAGDRAALQKKTGERSILTSLRFSPSVTL